LEEYYTVKAAHAITSVKQSPILKDLFFLSRYGTLHIN